MLKVVDMLTLVAVMAEFVDTTVAVVQLVRPNAGSSIGNATSRACTSSCGTCSACSSLCSHSSRSTWSWSWSRGRGVGGNEARLLPGPLYVLVVTLVVDFGVFLVGLGYCLFGGFLRGDVRGFGELPCMSRIEACEVRRLHQT